MESWAARSADVMASSWFCTPTCINLSSTLVIGARQWREHFTSLHQIFDPLHFHFLPKALTFSFGSEWSVVEWDAAQVVCIQLLKHISLEIGTALFFAVQTYVLGSDASPASSVVHRNSAMFRCWSIFLRNGWWRLLSIKLCTSLDVVFVLIDQVLFHLFTAHVPGLCLPSPSRELAR